MSLPRLTADQQRQLEQQTTVPGIGALIAAMGQGGDLYRYQWTSAAPAAKSASGSHAAVTLTTSAQDITTGITNPDVPRNLRVTITLGGGSQHTGKTVTVYGTDIAGNAISEDFDISSLATAAIVVGVKCFKTITHYALPIRTQASDQITLGTGDKLGIGKVLHNASLVKALRGTSAPLLTAERQGNGFAITDNSGGTDPGDDTIAAMTSPDLSAWNGSVDPTAAQATAIGLFCTRAKAAIAQLAAKLNTLGLTGTLVPSTVELCRNGYTPATVPDGSNLYQIFVIDEPN